VGNTHFLYANNTCVPKGHAYSNDDTYIHQ